MKLILKASCLKGALFFSEYGIKYNVEDIIGSEHNIEQNKNFVQCEKRKTGGNTK